MKSASVAEVKTHFSAYLKESEKGPVIVTRNGSPIAMLVALSEEDVEDIIAPSPRLQEILEAAHQRIQNGGGIPAVEFWARRKQRKAAPLNGKRRVKKT